MITLGVHTGCIGGIFITGIFGNFYTKRGRFLTFKTGIPGGLVGQHIQRTYYFTATYSFYDQGRRYVWTSGK